MPLKSICYATVLNIIYTSHYNGEHLCITLNINPNPDIYNTFVFNL